VGVSFGGNIHQLFKNYLWRPDMKNTDKDQKKQGKKPQMVVDIEIMKKKPKKELKASKTKSKVKC
jgi:hypothetical protein